MSIRQDAIKETKIHKLSPCFQVTYPCEAFPTSLARVTPQVDLITPLSQHTVLFLFTLLFPS